jgi:hypothetical protein
MQYVHYLGSSSALISGLASRSGVASRPIAVSAPTICRKRLWLVGFDEGVKGHLHPNPAPQSICSRHGEFRAFPHIEKSCSTSNREVSKSASQQVSLAYLSSNLRSRFAVCTILHQPCQGPRSEALSTPTRHFVRAVTQGVSNARIHHFTNQEVMSRERWRRGPCCLHQKSTN